MKNFLNLGMLLTLMTVYSGFAQAGCSLPIKTPFSLVALYKTNFLDRLENENRMREICPTLVKDCVNKALAPQTDKMLVYDHPAGKIIAELEVTYAPGKPMTVALIQNGNTHLFTPLVYDSDWGYGPWFHTTLLDQNGSWNNVVLPIIKSGWIELPKADVRRMDKVARDYDLGVIVTKSNNESITVRDAQPADNECTLEDPPPLSAFKEWIIPLSQLYDDQCNLLLRPTNLRGC